MITIPFPVNSARCITVNSDKQISVYLNSDQRDVYYLIGDTWKKSSSSYSSYGYSIGDYVCHNISEGFPYFRPETEVYFALISIFSFLFIVYFAFILILKKLWRRI